MNDSPQRAGGIARGAALSPERRAEIARQAAQARWSGSERKPKAPAPKKQGKKMADKISKTHAQAIEAMKDQLLIVLIDRAGGEAAVSVQEIDATGNRNLLMSLDGAWFHFVVRPKSQPQGLSEHNIMKEAPESGRPDYDEH